MELLALLSRHRSQCQALPMGITRRKVKWAHFSNWPFHYYNNVRNRRFAPVSKGNTVAVLGALLSFLIVSILLVLFPLGYNALSFSHHINSISGWKGVTAGANALVGVGEKKVTSQQQYQLNETMRNRLENAFYK